MFAFVSLRVLGVSCSLCFSPRLDLLVDVETYEEGCDCKEYAEDEDDARLALRPILAPYELMHGTVGARDQRRVNYSHGGRSRAVQLQEISC